MSYIKFLLQLYIIFWYDESHSPLLYLVTQQTVFLLQIAITQIKSLKIHNTSFQQHKHIRIVALSQSTVEVSLSYIITWNINLKISQLNIYYDAGFWWSVVEDIITWCKYLSKVSNREELW